MNRRIDILEDEEDYRLIFNRVQIMEITRNDSFFARELVDTDENIPLLSIWDNPHFTKTSSTIFLMKKI